MSKSRQLEHKLTTLRLELAEARGALGLAGGGQACMLAALQPGACTPHACMLRKTAGQPGLPQQQAMHCHLPAQPAALLLHHMLAACRRGGGGGWAGR